MQRLATLSMLLLGCLLLVRAHGSSRRGTGDRDGERSGGRVLARFDPQIDELLAEMTSATSTWRERAPPTSAINAVADVLFGEAPPTGKLAYSRPRSMTQLPINVGDAEYHPLFPFGFGLSY